MSTRLLVSLACELWSLIISNWMRFFFLMVVLSCLMSMKHLVVVKLKLNVKLLVIVLSCLVCCLMWTVNIDNLLTIGFGALWFMHLVLGCGLNIFLANFFNRSGHRLFKSGWADPQKIGLGHGSTRFCFGSKNSSSGQVSGRVGSANSDTFCHVYLHPYRICECKFLVIFWVK